MGGYRFYFLDKRGSVLLRKDFEASDDHQALHIADLVARVFSLTCSGFALWQGKRQIWEGRSAVSATRPGIGEDLALDAEDVLQRSGWRLATSQRLLAELARSMQVDLTTEEKGQGTA